MQVHTKPSSFWEDRDRLQALPSTNCQRYNDEIPENGAFSLCHVVDTRVRESALTCATTAAIKISRENLAL
jgi:hypothetical protein